MVKRIIWMYPLSGVVFRYDSIRFSVYVLPPRKIYVRFCFYLLLEHEGVLELFAASFSVIRRKQCVNKIEKCWQKSKGFQRQTVRLHNLRSPSRMWRWPKEALKKYLLTHMFQWNVLVIFHQYIYRRGLSLSLLDVRPNFIAKCDLIGECEAQNYIIIICECAFWYFFVRLSQPGIHERISRGRISEVWKICAFHCHRTVTADGTYKIERITFRRVFISSHERCVAREAENVFLKIRRRV